MIRTKREKGERERGDLGLEGGVEGGEKVDFVAEEKVGAGGLGVAVREGGLEGGDQKTLRVEGRADSLGLLLQILLGLSQISYLLLPDFSLCPFPLDLVLQFPDLSLQSLYLLLGLLPDPFLLFFSLSLGLFVLPLFAIIVRGDLG